MNPIANDQPCKVFSCVDQPSLSKSVESSNDGSRVGWNELIPRTRVHSPVSSSLIGRTSKAQRRANSDARAFCSAIFSCLPVHVDVHVIVVSYLVIVVIVRPQIR